MGTPEYNKAKKITDDYIALKKAIADPNYPSSAHTHAALMRVEALIKQMGRNYIYKLAFEKLIPIHFKTIMNETT